MQTQKTERETHNYVLGWDVSPNGLINGCAVFSPQKKEQLVVDHSQPVTLARCAQIFAAAEKMSGRTLGAIEIRLSVYGKTPGNECGDFAETCFLDKRYKYQKSANSLEILEFGECVYINQNGAILRGDDAHVAYSDCL